MGIGSNFSFGITVHPANWMAPYNEHTVYFCSALCSFIHVEGSFLDDFITEPFGIYIFNCASAHYWPTVFSSYKMYYNHTATFFLTSSYYFSHKFNPFGACVCAIPFVFGALQFTKSSYGDQLLQRLIL